MAVLLPDQLDDFVELTLDRYKKKQWSDVSLDNQYYCFPERFITGKKNQVKGGTTQKWKVQVANTGTARRAGLFSTSQTNVANLTVGASQNWSIATANFAYDIMEEAFQGDDMTMIVDEIKVREHSMYNDWFTLMEEMLWTAPSSSSEDPRSMSGIPFWIQKNSTEGFNGGNPSGFSDGAGGVNATTYPGTKNYTANHSDEFTRENLIAKWIRAMNFCYFRAPHKYPELGGGMPQWEFYTTFRVLEPLNQFMDSRNDNLRDLAGMAGKLPAGTLPFYGIPVRWIPELERTDAAGYDATNPVYGINWKTFDFFFQRGWDMRRHPPRPAANQPNVREVHLFSAQNLACVNRRGNFVLYNGD